MSLVYTPVFVSRCVKTCSFDFKTATKTSPQLFETKRNETQTNPPQKSTQRLRLGTMSNNNIKEITLNICVGDSLSYFDLLSVGRYKKTTQATIFHVSAIAFVLFFQQ